MSIRLQFFSRPSDEDTRPATVELGYDGSMAVESFDPVDIQQYLARMDCVFGQCVVVATEYDCFGPGRDRVNAYETTRTHE